MELQHPQLPVPVALTQQPESRTWPAVPTHAPTPSIAATDIRLPNLQTILSPDYEPATHGSAQHSRHDSMNSPGPVRSLPPIDVGHANAYGAHRSLDAAMTSPMGAGSVMSLDDKAVSVASVEDPDERIAAEALAGLGNPDFGRTAHIHMSSHASPAYHARASDTNTQPEPLLELISQAHPWVGGTIKGSLTAYSTTKHYSPRIVQFGANLVERNITTPVVSVVSSVGGITGVDNGLRRYLGNRRPADSARKHDSGMRMDIEHGYGDDGSAMRIDAIESPTDAPPDYRSSRPPSYREVVSPTFDHRRDIKSRDGRPSSNRSWSSQLLITTSGLSVALSNTSRHSLRYALRMLQGSFDHVSNLTTALSMILRQYEETREHHMRQNTNSALEKGERPSTPEQNPNAKQLADAIQQHCTDIWNAIRYVTGAVSNSVGGALPENARQFVRQQLMSLPQRWQVASNQLSSESETTRSAQRMIGFASEGLDMMTQVSNVLKCTLDSAEAWLDRVGRRDREDQRMLDAGPGRYAQQTEKS